MPALLGKFPVTGWWVVCYTTPCRQVMSVINLRFFQKETNAVSACV